MKTNKRNGPASPEPATASKPAFRRPHATLIEALKRVFSPEALNPAKSQDAANSKQAAAKPGKRVQAA